MNYITLIGLFGTLIGLISFRAMLWKIYTEGITINFPYESLILTLIGWSLTIIYGILSKSVVVITLGSVYLTIFSSILITKILNPSKG
jgi:hypothetical protein